MSKNYKSYKLEKWLYFGLAIAVYFLPLIITTACVFPVMKKADVGYKVALGFVVIITNTAPVLIGLSKWVTAHLPFMNWFAILYLLLFGIFSFAIFQEYAKQFAIIEGVSAVCGIISSVLFHLHRKYARWSESIKANVKSGAFVTK